MEGCGEGFREWEQHILVFDRLGRLEREPKERCEGWVESSEHGRGGAKAIAGKQAKGA